ncbi:MAG: FAD-linked oxidase C-terminal domain-containing protein [Pseudomonadota bacterium]
MQIIRDASQSPLARRLGNEIAGEVMFDPGSRGRYATDASIYQMVPAGVVVPRSGDDVAAVLATARDEGLSITMRGGGTSQCGQTVNSGIVLDCVPHLGRILEIDVENRSAVVEPGVVLDTLNRVLKPHGLWFPVDVSTGSRATIGGMTANNSCGARSRRYGMMRDNVIAIDALMADGTRARFGALTPGANFGAVDAGLAADLLELGRVEASEIDARFPKVDRRVGGYNFDALIPPEAAESDGRPINLAHLLVGSEGTLAISERITLKLSPLPGAKLTGVCHFPTFREAMEATQHLVKLDPMGVELIDHNLIRLAEDNAVFKPILAEFVRGEPEALLLVEFAEPEMVENRRRLDALHDVMSDLGFAFGVPGKREGGVVEATDPGLQARIGEVRKQGLNIMMSMKSEGKPVSFVEDCCVRLEDLADYTENLTAIFHKHGTDGTWYAHASVGTLHVRPVLNLKQDTGVKALRAIADEAMALVQSYQGSHSGEHGDGIVRSEFHERMFGSRMVRNFRKVKERFDPTGVLNPRKIVDAPRMDDRSLMRYGPGYTVPEVDTVLDWPGHKGAGRGLQGAVEMCNNNGACRKLEGGVMCPSYRATREERDSVRGRANTLRLALSGQIEGGLASAPVAEAMKHCVGCKACRRECPMAVDMAAMKSEAARARAELRGLHLRELLVAHMPAYAPLAARFPTLSNLRNRSPLLAKLMERVVGLDATRPLPEWRGDWYRTPDTPEAMLDADVILFADTFNRHFEPEHLRAARRVLEAAGLRVAHAVAGAEDGRPERSLCCGRTYLSTGLADRAKVEMARTAAALAPALSRGIPVVGLEPSCVLSFRDEVPRVLGRAVWPAEWDGRVMLFEEYLASPLAQGHNLPLGPVAARKALVHGHCHQKSYGQMGPVEAVLRRIPGLEVEVVETSCCGMAGSFGYQAETAEVSRRMAEASLVPAVRAADADTIILADGTSCRHQIADLAEREAVHVAIIVAEAMDAAGIVDQPMAAE